MRVCFLLTNSQEDSNCLIDQCDLVVLVFFLNLVVMVFHSLCVFPVSLSLFFNCLQILFLSSFA